MNFSIDFNEILNKITKIDPISYAKTRNYVDGDVTYLSPYLSRGIISTKQITQSIFERGFSFQQSEKFIQELAWRDYWQICWNNLGNRINQDIKQEQKDVENEEIPAAIVQARTDIKAIDQAIEKLYETGYMHNHLRMYVASICSNIGKSHWHEPAKWMYYHLLDGDWASNALSWQWVAGTNSNKKYLANQENINKYTYSNQSSTFLDHSYEALAQLQCPEKLQLTQVPNLATELPKNLPIHLDRNRPTLIYNYYNLDPKWHQGENVNRILLLEPSIFEEYPISQKSLDFVIQFAKKNINEVQVYTGEFKSLVKRYQAENIIYKQHPLNFNYQGTEEAREWIFPTQVYYPSFFKFWNKHKSQLDFWRKSA